MGKHKKHVNLHYKDSLFRLLFGSEQYKENILSLYNALNGTDYKDVSDIEIYTISDVIYIKMKNDLAFIFDSYLSLWEQQSSFNPNMPIRGLMYFGNIYSKYIESNKLNIYGSKLIKLPAPQYIVFYNGKSDMKPIEKLRLSDAFVVPDNSGAFEWTATVYNLNKGKNDVLLEKCKPLYEYMILTERIRDSMLNNYDFEIAVDKAVTSCIKDGILKEFLLSHRAEVKDMVLTEFNEEVFVKGIKEEGREEQMRDHIASMLRRGKSPQAIFEFCDYPMDLILEVQNSLLATE
ncbi:MAG: hypothetical protein J6M92_16550 [Oribacterium sp.]|nr:hypothetical protein [Oribacterium sp.]